VNSRRDILGFVVPEGYGDRASVKGRHRTAVRWLYFVAPVFFLAAPSSADEPDLPACVGAYERGQQLLRAGQLVQAHEDLLVCARAPCPAPMWGDCLRWLDQDEQRMPSVVLAAQDAGGHDVRDVRVVLDGKPLVDHLDAHAIPIDPGQHTFRFERAEGAGVEERLMIREGEKARLISVTLAPASLDAPRSHAVAPHPGGEQVSHGPMVGPYLLGAFGLLALGSFTYFGLSGRADYFNLEHSCGPHCSSSQVAPGRTKLIVADISLGVSVVALGAAAYLFLAGRTTTPRAVEGSRARLSVQGSPGGALGVFEWVY
jgi:hypothetical protein